MLLSLHYQVAEMLDKEPNKSLVADTVLAAYYGLSFTGNTPSQKKRLKLLEKINANTPEDPPESAPPLPDTPAGFRPVVQAFEPVNPEEAPAGTQYPCLVCGTMSEN